MSGTRRSNPIMSTSTAPPAGIWRGIFCVWRHCASCTWVRVIELYSASSPRHYHWHILVSYTHVRATAHPNQPCDETVARYRQQCELKDGIRTCWGERRSEIQPSASAKNTLLSHIQSLLYVPTRLTLLKVRETLKYCFRKGLTIWGLRFQFSLLNAFFKTKDFGEHARYSNQNRIFDISSPLFCSAASSCIKSKYSVYMLME